VSLAGRTLSHYVVIEEISRGGMGVVYRATDTRLGRDVALKVLPAELMADAERRHRFTQEARAAATLEHPNIAVIHDIGQVEGVDFIAMELVRGDKLSASLTRGALPASRALELGIEIAEGLARAHDQGIIHRDLKPANVMLTDDGHAKIIDFGLAKLIAPLDGDSGRQTMTMGGGTDPGLVMGTVSYMSPEQAGGGGVDHRSDVFSFGILLYELLTGVVPFRTKTSIDTLHAILNLPAPPLPTLTPAEVTSEVQRILDKCLAKDPRGRYQGMRDLAVDLRAAHRHLDTAGHARESGPVVAVPAGGKSKWMALAVAGAVLAAITAGGFLVSRQMAGPPEETAGGKPSVAVLYFENNTGNPQLDWLRTGLTDMMVTDLSQSPDLEVLGTDRLLQILTAMGRQDDKVISADVMQEIARRAGVKTVLVGSYVKAGDTIRINLKMQEGASGRIITSERVEANGESNLFPTMDELTRRIKSKFTLPGAGGATALFKAPNAAASNAIDDTFDRDLREVTTSSIEAYRYYAEGINLHERLRSEQALPLLEKAVAIDPGFALAYTKLAVVHGNLQHSNLRDEYAKKALAHLDRLTPRERFYIQAYYYSGNPDTLDKAIENYTKALELSQNHTSSRNNLGLILLQLWRFDEAIRHYTVLQDRGFEFPGAAAALFLAHHHLGQTERGVEVLERYSTRFPDAEVGFANLGMGRAVAGQTAEAHAAFDRATALRPGLPGANIGRIGLAMLADRWDDVESAARDEARSGDPAIQLRGNIVLANRELYRGRSREALKFLATGVASQGAGGSNESAGARARAAWLLLARQQPAEALAEATRGLAEARGRGARFELLGIAAAAAAQQGRGAEAAKSLDALTQSANALPGSDREKIRVHLTAGLMALAAKDTLSAVRELGQAESKLPAGGFGTLGPADQRRPIIWFALGTAYLAAGQDADAKARFERIIARDYERLYRPVEFVRSFYYLGQIAERQGDAVKARQHYARFAKYWKDGDLDRPQVEEALRKSQGA
jgi:TolB-like protein/tetratricopeptide (TPR) repeat protein